MNYGAMNITFLDMEFDERLHFAGIFLGVKLLGHKVYSTLISTTKNFPREIVLLSLPFFACLFYSNL